MEALVLHVGREGYERFNEASVVLCRAPTVAVLVFVRICVPSRKVRSAMTRPYRRVLVVCMKSDVAEMKAVSQVFAVAIVAILTGCRVEVAMSLLRGTRHLRVKPSSDKPSLVQDGVCSSRGVTKVPAVVVVVAVSVLAQATGKETVTVTMHVARFIVVPAISKR